MVFMRPKFDRIGLQVKPHNGEIRLAKSRCLRRCSGRRAPYERPGTRRAAPPGSDNGLSSAGMWTEARDLGIIAGLRDDEAVPGVPQEENRARLRGDDMLRGSQSIVFFCRCLA